jgi:uncharacterized protein YwqG
MDKASFAVAIQRTGLRQLTPVLDQLTSSSIRISTNPSYETAIQLGQSKFGGMPDLPANLEWPSMNSAPMEFIAQIQLAEAQPYDSANLLPSHGLLSFFYDASQETYGADPKDKAGLKVLYLTEEASSLQRTDLPPLLPAEARSRVCSVGFSQELTMTLQPNLEVSTLKWSDDDQEKYDSALQALAGGSQHPIHRMLGFPDTIQDDMRMECQLAANGIADPASEPEQVAKLAAGANDWLLLLQVDSDESVGMRWANAGMLYFWIRRDDLANQRFEHVWVVLQSE